MRSSNKYTGVTGRDGQYNCHLKYHAGLLSVLSSNYKVQQ